MQNKPHGTIYNINLILGIQMEYMDYNKHRDMIRYRFTGLCMICTKGLSFDGAVALCQNKTQSAHQAEPT